MDKRISRGLAALPAVLIAAVALALLWPVPRGSMPLSADHTVHLTRIVMFAEQLAQGRLRGWDSTWFFGTPVGELYPVLGDLLIIAGRALSGGLLSWPQAYALGFTVVFTLQGWALLRAGRALGLGPAPGLVAALLCLVDVGAYREGGWLYTVTYGVWPQALSTALTWLAVAELCVAAKATDALVRRRRIATAALAVGAALLAHPMAMMSLALAGPILGLGLPHRSGPSRASVFATVGVSLGLGVSLAAWWLGPMLAHRAWMASYGWMWLPLSRMVDHAIQGQWAQSMPTAVGVAVSGGLVLVMVMGSRPARCVATLAVVQWLLASRDLLWTFRLDQLSEGFTHIQYQRFLIAAKPGLWLTAGAGLTTLMGKATVVWRHQARWGRPTAGLMAATALGLSAWMVVDQARVSSTYEVGTTQQQRLPGHPTFDDDYAQLIEWMREQPAHDPAPYRATVVASRNQHWFMDAPALSGMRLYKQGFTPGDNFVHKPEARSPILLDRLRVRYVITALGRTVARLPVVARFGTITVHERPNGASHPIAWLQGPGTLEILEDNVDGGVVRAQLTGTTEPTQVVFGVAGYPRWSLLCNGEPVEWFEVPAVGDAPAATPAQRRAGALRGGKAHGDDGTEPILIAARVQPGTLELRYDARQPLDLGAGLLSLCALLLCGVLVTAPSRWTGPTHGLHALMRPMKRLGHPIGLGIIATVLLVAAIVKQRQASARERIHAMGWPTRIVEPTAGARPGLLKTDMLIRPAILVKPRRPGPARITFKEVTLGPTLTGWIALDDDDAKQRRRGRHTIRIEADEGNGDSVTLTSIRLPHRPGRRILAIDTADLAGRSLDLRVVIESEGGAPPSLGFDLMLGAPP